MPGVLKNCGYLRCLECVAAAFLWRGRFLHVDLLLFPVLFFKIYIFFYIRPLPPTPNIYIYIYTSFSLIMSSNSCTRSEKWRCRPSSFSNCCKTSLCIFFSSFWHSCNFCVKKSFFSVRRRFVSCYFFNEFSSCYLSCLIIPSYFLNSSPWSSIIFSSFYVSY